MTSGPHEPPSNLAEPAATRAGRRDVPQLGIAPAKASASGIPRPVAGHAGTWEIALTGRVYADVVPALAERLQAALTEGMQHLVVDGRTLLQLDFAGMDMLTQLLRELVAANGRIAFYGLNPDVERMLELTGLLLLTDAFVERAAALESLQALGDPVRRNGALLHEVSRRIHVLARAMPPAHFGADSPRTRFTRAAFDAFVNFVGEWGTREGTTKADQTRRDVRNVVERLANGWTPRPSDEDIGHVIGVLEAELLGEGPLERLLSDPTISEIMVNGPGRILVERNGRIEQTDFVFRDEEHLEHTIRRIADSVERRIDYANPTLDAYLPDGSRVHAIFPPIAIDGASLSIRKFAPSQVQLEDLILYGTLTPEMAYFLSAAVKGRLNIVISGPASSGKTTTMNALASLVPSGERIVTIEEIAEMDLSRAHAHVVRLQTRISNIEGKGELSTRQLVREALRMRADRILVGEARGAEMVEVLQAMRCGHDGSMTTIHASGPEDLIERAVTLALFANLGLSEAGLRRMVLDGIDLVVHMHRFPDGARRIVRISEPERSEAGETQMHDVFTFEHEGYDRDGRAIGSFHHIEPSRHREHLARQGIEVPWEAFEQTPSRESHGAPASKPF